MSMRYPGGLIATTPVNQQYPSGVWTGPQSAPYQANNVWGSDPFFRNTTLLLHGDGATTPFTKDASTNNFQLTIFGDTKPNSKTPFTPPSGVTTYGSGYFDGTGDYLTVPNTTNASGNFTYEFWMYATGYGSGGYGTMVDASFTSASNVFQFSTWSGAPNRILGYVGALAGAGNLSPTLAQPVLNRWIHIAIVRSGSTVTMYENGTSVATLTMTNTINFGTALTIGSDRATSYPFEGYLSNVRLVIGTAVYTSNFTTPTSPLTPVANTILLTLQTNGPANNNAFIDSSANNYIITRTGSITQGSFTPYDPGYYSNYFDGSGDYLTLPNATTLALGTSDFTVEGWFNFSSSSAAAPYYNFGLVSCYENQSGSSGFTLAVSTSSNSLNVGIGDTNLLTTPFTVSVGTWYHFAVSRSSGTIRLFVNGALATSASNSSNFTTSTNPTSIGSINVYGTGNTMLFTGYASNVRIVKGTAVYTSAFTPSTTPLTAVTNTALLTCQSNRLLDNSTNAYTITKNGDVSVQGFQPFPPALQYTPASFSGSGYFFGASNALQTPSGTCPVINDFSASGWVYRTSVPGYQQTFIAIGLDGAGRVGFFWTGSNFEYNIYGSSTVTIDGSGSMPVGAWTYVVLTRTGSTITLYYNGVLRATVSQGTAFSAASGRSMSWMDGTIGYATNLRFDTAAYSSPTTVPTAPLSPTANTNNLLNFTNAGIFDNAGQNNLVTVGNSQVNTSVVKYGTGSMYFDGTGDWLLSPNNQAMVSGSGNFTIECWINLSNLSSTKGILFGADTNCLGFRVGQSYLGNVNGLGICRNNVTDVEYCAFTFATNTWYHVAVVRNGTSILFFVNGVQQTTVGSGGGSYSFAVPSSGYYVGCNNATTEPFAGYIDDIRMTRGVARYISNFTPPVARMPNQ